MQRTTVHGLELEYERTGSGEPMLLIHGALIPDAMSPLERQDALDEFELIRLHRRGYGGSSQPPGDVTIADHAADAVGLLDALDVDRAHVVGHSSGAAIAIEAAALAPERVASLSLLEPPYIPGNEEAWASALAPAVERNERGDVVGAVETFFSLIGDERWRTAIETTVPGGVEQAQKHAALSFGVELPAVNAWSFSRERSSAITCGVLSVVGTSTSPAFVEVRERLHEWFPQCVDADIPGATHLLQMEAPAAVAAAIARFVA